MAERAKYLFDQDFAAVNPAERPVLPAEHVRMLAEAESKGFRDGFAAAEKEGHSVAERRTAAAFERIGDALDRMARGLATIERRVETESIELAATIARKLAPELVLRKPFAEIAALVTECFCQLTQAPHVVVRVNDALHETARTELEEIARARGFAGRIVVVAEPQIASADCKLEWADGGIVRDAARIDRAIGDAIARYLGTRPAALLPELGGIGPDAPSPFRPDTSQDSSQDIEQ
jgi:flagellar assembly protein FliH